MQGTEYGGIVDHVTDAVTLGASTLILLTGIRSAEACGLDAADVHAVERPWSHVRRKGRWAQNIAVSPTVARAFRRAIGHRETGPVLIWQGKRLSEGRLCTIVRNAAQAVGARDITTHSLRRTFCTLCREAGSTRPADHGFRRM